MPLKPKKKEFKFTFQVFLRLLIFFLVVAYLISYLSTQKNTNVLSSVSDPTLLIDESATPKSYDLSGILNSAYEKLPDRSKDFIDNMDDTYNHSQLGQKVKELKNDSTGFFEKQVKEIKKAIVKSVYDDILKSIENN